MPDTPDNTPEQGQNSTVQFAYGLSPGPGAPLNPELLAWREVLMRQDLLGRDPLRYGGQAYGNLSTRLAATQQGSRATSTAPDGLFIISAGQAEHRDHHDPATWTTIDTVNLGRFWAEARGTLPPSRHTMTHATIYSAEPNAQFVFHVSCPEIWRNADALLLPGTPTNVPAGSPAMIQAIIDLLAANMSRPLVFVTHSDPDSVFALGPTARDAGGLLTSYLARALTLEAKAATYPATRTAAASTSTDTPPPTETLVK